MFGNKRLYDRIEELTSDKSTLQVLVDGLKRRIEKLESDNAFLEASLDATAADLEKARQMYNESERIRKELCRERDAYRLKAEHIEGLE